MKCFIPLLVGWFECSRITPKLYEFIRAFIRTFIQNYE